MKEDGGRQDEAEEPKQGKSMSSDVKVSGNGLLKIQ